MHGSLRRDYASASSGNLSVPAIARHRTCLDSYRWNRNIPRGGHLTDRKPCRRQHLQCTGRACGAGENKGGTIVRKTSAPGAAANMHGSAVFQRSTDKIDRKTSTPITAAGRLPRCCFPTQHGISAGRRRSTLCCSSPLRRTPAGLHSRPSAPAYCRPAARQRARSGGVWRHCT